VHLVGFYYKKYMLLHQEIRQVLVYTLKSDVPSSVRTVEARICLVVKKVSKYSDQFSLQ
jgi:hypothetical protein